MKKKVDCLNHISVICIDLDGVIFLGNELIEGSKNAVKQLEDWGYQIAFVTNNSTKAIEKIETKLRDTGFVVHSEQVFSSLKAAPRFLERLDPLKSKNALIIGSEDLKKEIQKTGRKIVPTPPCDYLLVGFDQNCDYETVSLGLNALDSGAQFIVCNKEKKYPVEGDIYKPGCGALVAAIETCSDRKADFVIGKPEVFLLEMVTEVFHRLPAEILVIGDSLENDIQMANNYNAFSGWVNPRNHSCPVDIDPSFTINSLLDLTKLILSTRKGCVLSN